MSEHVREAHVVKGAVASHVYTYTYKERALYDSKQKSGPSGTCAEAPLSHSVSLRLSLSDSVHCQSFVFISFATIQALWHALPLSMNKGYLVFRFSLRGS